MKLMGEELADIGRRYIALSPLFLLCFLVGPIFFAAAAQSRLNAAYERVHDAQLRQQMLSEFMALMAEAESGERGFLLTGDNSYLHSEAVDKIGPALERVQAAYGIALVARAEMQELQDLADKKLHELQDTLALHGSGIAPPLDAARTGVGKQTMEQISKLVGSMRQKETVELAAATARWRSQLEHTRWMTAAGALINIGLVLLAARLVYGEMRRRALQATALRDQKQELERQVAERTRELTALSTHLQGVSEQEKSALSRELHDELGGLLVAARMDLSWLQQRLPTSDPAIEQRFKRIHESLSAGVDLKRRVVEELRPTLLDNMGLFSALRWQFKETCRRAGLRCSETIPEVELEFNPDAAIGVFRVAQEALTNILKHAEAKSADLTVQIGDQMLVLRITDDGKGIPLSRLKTATSHGLAAMRHRIAALGGTWEVGSRASGGTFITARIPMRRMLRTTTLPLSA
jgi:signal transduction histidine kinase